MPIIERQCKSLHPTPSVTHVLQLLRATSQYRIPSSSSISYLVTSCEGPAPTVRTKFQFIDAGNRCHEGLDTVYAC